ncbi:unnamed protein product [Somion occarium]|uniref:RRM domain-containing protein n=1 Tax=Somion occarium TaxID=3059160 RepID=A0ABP1CKJ3_9APHY
MAADKLTKKQKKALAFRERKGKGKAKEDAQHDVPIAEDQDLAEIHDVETQEAAQETVVVRQDAVSGKKRKREVQEDQPTSEKGKEKQSEKKTTKKRKGDGAEAVPTGTDNETEPSSTGKAKKKGRADAKQRFILFVGNLKYSTAREAVQKHFAACEPPPDVRLMTPKPSVTSRPTAKSKGFAFLEFINKQALQQALKLHGSDLEGRKINVELTAGGGGKSETRITKVKERNKELHEQRKKRLAKQKTSKDGEAPEQMERPQRYSATSGVDQIPLIKRTWSVPDGSEEAPKKKRGSKNKRPPKPFGTGVNAIPVG